MEDEPFEARIGMFFYVIGGVALMLFIISDIANRVDFDFFFVSLIMFVIGYYLRRSLPSIAPSVERFTGFKNFVRKMRERRENKKAPKKDKK